MRNGKRLVDGIEVQRGSSNAYADLGLPNAEKLKIKTRLVIEIKNAIHSLGLTQQEAAKRMGISQPKVSDIVRRDFANLSERNLMGCLTRLGRGDERRAQRRGRARRCGPLGDELQPCHPC